jgi:predicted transcriptional regulator
MENRNLLNWLEKSKKSDEKEINVYRQEILEQIKGLNKEDIIKKEEKLTLWKRIRKALNF